MALTPAQAAQGQIQPLPLLRQRQGQQRAWLSGGIRLAFLEALQLEPVVVDGVPEQQPLGPALASNRLPGVAAALDPHQTLQLQQLTAGLPGIHAGRPGATAVAPVPPKHLPFSQELVQRAIKDHDPGETVPGPEQQADADGDHDADAGVETAVEDVVPVQGAVARHQQEQQRDRGRCGQPPCQPSSRSSGTVISRLSSTAGQPWQIVCTRKATRPPATVPKRRERAALRVSSSLSSTTKITARSGYQTNSMRWHHRATEAVINALSPSRRLPRTSWDRTARHLEPTAPQGMAIPCRSGSDRSRRWGHPSVRLGPLGP